METPILTIYRRKLPHWRMEGAFYFVTWRLGAMQLPLSAPERALVVDAIRHFEGRRYHLTAYVVMDDHVHVVVMPLEDFPLQQVVQSWKSFSARGLQKRFGRSGAIWDREYHDRIVRNDAELAQKVEYILANPVRRWPDIEDYPWVGLGSCGD